MAVCGKPKSSWFQIAVVTGFALFSLLYLGFVWIFFNLSAILEI